ncbi:MAG: hypothetical protein BMS9Abin26_1153 [Gammaproteobacteria bacterium]|nr:MAG: hypothetical protein BMS9Abin26_1153 [Gammaproteobacteria bacterium]
MGLAGHSVAIIRATVCKVPILRDFIVFPDYPLKSLQK